MNQNYPTREDAINLLHEYTKTDSLRRHALGVEQAIEKWLKNIMETLMNGV